MMCLLQGPQWAQDTGVSLSIEVVWSLLSEVLLSEDLLPEVVVCDSSEPEPGL